MYTSEFIHYDGCHHRDPDNCSACALTDEKQDSPNYAAWPLAYMENKRAIPVKWRQAFKDELKSDNEAYVENIYLTIEKYGLRFTDGYGL